MLYLRKFWYGLTGYTKVYQADTILTFSRHVLGLWTHLSEDNKKIKSYQVFRDFYVDEFRRWQEKMMSWKDFSISYRNPRYIKILVKINAILDRNCSKPDDVAHAKYDIEEIKQELRALQYTYRSLGYASLLRQLLSYMYDFLSDLDFLRKAEKLLSSSTEGLVEIVVEKDGKFKKIYLSLLTFDWERYKLLKGLPCDFNPAKVAGIDMSLELFSATKDKFYRDNQQEIDLKW